MAARSIVGVLRTPRGTPPSSAGTTTGLPSRVVQTMVPGGSAGSPHPAATAWTQPLLVAANTSAVRRPA